MANGVTTPATVVPRPGPSQRRVAPLPAPGLGTRAVSPQPGGVGSPPVSTGLAQGVAGAGQNIARGLMERRALSRQMEEKQRRRENEALNAANSAFAQSMTLYGTALETIGKDTGQLQSTLLQLGPGGLAELPADFLSKVTSHQEALDQVRNVVRSDMAETFGDFSRAFLDRDADAISGLVDRTVRRTQGLLAGDFDVDELDGAGSLANELQSTNMTMSLLSELRKAGVDANLVKTKMEKVTQDAAEASFETARLAHSFFGVNFTGQPEQDQPLLTSAMNDLTQAAITAFVENPEVVRGGAVSRLKSVLNTYTRDTLRGGLLAEQIDSLLEDLEDGNLRSGHPVLLGAMQAATVAASSFEALASGQAEIAAELINRDFAKGDHVVSLDGVGLLNKAGRLTPDAKQLLRVIGGDFAALAATLQTSDGVHAAAVRHNQAGMINELLKRVNEQESIANGQPLDLLAWESILLGIAAEDPRFASVVEAVDQKFPGYMVALEQFTRRNQGVPSPVTTESVVGSSLTAPPSDNVPFGPPAPPSVAPAPTLENNQQRQQQIQQLTAPPTLTPAAGGG